MMDLLSSSSDFHKVFQSNKRISNTSVKLHVGERVSLEEKVVFQKTSTPACTKYEDSGYFSDASLSFNFSESPNNSENFFKKRYKTEEEVSLERKLSFNIIECDSSLLADVSNASKPSTSDKITNELAPQKEQPSATGNTVEKHFNSFDFKYKLSSTGILSFSKADDCDGSVSMEDKDTSYKQEHQNITDSFHHFAQNRDAFLNNQQNHASVFHSFYNNDKVLQSPNTSKHSSENHGELSAHVDFLKELSQRNCLSVISQIFSNLDPSDICVLSWVNTEWRKTVLRDTSARKIHRKYIRSQRQLINGPNKENRKPKNNFYFVIPSNEEMVLNSGLQNMTKKQRISQTQLFSSLQDIANLEEGIRFQKCPRCSYSSRIEIQKLRGTCLRELCSYEFCVRCFCPYELFHTCSFACNNDEFELVSQSSYKKSKHNLRRL